MRSDGMRQNLLLKHMGGATSRNFKKMRCACAWCDKLQHTFSDRAILMYKPPLERQHASNPTCRCFFVWCDSIMHPLGLKGNVGMYDFEDFKNLIDGKIDQKAFEILSEYYGIDEKMFEIARKNPFVKFILAPDWKKLVKRFGDDFTKDEDKFVPMCERLAKGEKV